MLALLTLYMPPDYKFDKEGCRKMGSSSKPITTQSEVSMTLGNKTFENTV